MKVFEQIEKYTSYALLALMSIIVISGTIEVGYTIVINILEPPGFFLGVADLYSLFGLFLMVLIGIELMAAIKSFAMDHTIHAEIMILIAITAIARKIVIMDAKSTDPMAYFAIGFVAIALTVGFYLIRRSRAQTDS